LTILLSLAAACHLIGHFVHLEAIV
jgi:hypothetical protein